jgi:hypothetical protein
MILIATLIRFNKNNLPKSSFTRPYKKLLPDDEPLAWLSYIVSLAQIVHISRETGRVEASFENEVLTLEVPFDTFLAEERIKKLQKPGPIAIQFIKR